MDSRIIKEIDDFLSSNINLLRIFNTKKSKKLNLNILLEDLEKNKYVNKSRKDYLCKNIRGYDGKSKFYIPLIYGCYLEKQDTDSTYPHGVNYELFRQSHIFISSASIIAKENNPFVLHKLFDNQNNNIIRFDFPEALNDYIIDYNDNIYYSPHFSKLKNMKNNYKKINYLGDFKSVLIPSTWE